MEKFYGLKYKGVVTNSDVAEAICVLGAADKIVGVSDTCLQRLIVNQKLQSDNEVGTWSQPSVGLAYFVKWLRPELFADLDPGAIHREILKNFYGLEAKGTWVYPGKH